MKTVCIVNFNIYALIDPSSEAVMGGAELDMFVLAHALKSDYKVKIITADWGQEDAVNISTNITLYKTFKLKRNLAAYLRAPLRFLYSLKKMNADIYVTTSASPEVGLIALFARLYGKKFIYRTAHQIDCDGTYIKNNGVKGMFYKYGLKNASAIVVSVHQHKDLLKLSHPTLQVPIFFISLGIDLPKEGGGRIIEKDHILWVARCEEWKQPNLFLDLARRFQEHPFVMICPKQKQNERLFQKIKEEAARISNLQFFGYVPFRDIHPYFEKAKLFINTSLTEGFTYTLIQSGMTGTPVVYLNVDPDGVIEKNNLGYFSWGDISLMEKQVKLILNDGSDWQKKSENIRQYTTMEHGAASLRLQWLKLINSI